MRLTDIPLPSPSNTPRLEPTSTPALGPEPTNTSSTDIPPTSTAVVPSTEIPTTIPTAQPLPPVTPDYDSLLQQALAQTSEGRIGYNDVNQAVVDKPFVVKAYVIRDTSAEAEQVLVTQVAQDAPESSAPRVQSVSVSSLMRVRLVAQDPRDFEITPLHTSERQPVGREDATNWSWSVRPLRAGRNKKLELRVVATVHIPGTNEEMTKDLDPQIIELSVDVNPTYTILNFLKAYGWLLLILLVVGIFFTYLWKHNIGKLPNTVPPGISPALYSRLRIGLLKYASLESDIALRSLFIDARIVPWRDDLPDANTAKQRVQALINFLYAQTNHQGDNALILFLRVLSEQHNRETACHHDLSELAAELEASLEEKRA